MDAARGWINCIRVKCYIYNIKPGGIDANLLVQEQGTDANLVVQEDVQLEECI
jgi:hypothetical protein